VEIWLPVAEDDVAVADPVAHPTAPLAAPTVRPLVILAVDDDGLVLMNTAAMLEDLGHRVIDVGSGAEALAALDAEPGIDLVVSDQAMPGMTGVQLAAAIRARRPEMPIILATGYAELPGGEGAALPRLAKPFTQAQLAQALEAVAA
jgi:CheY-like chemotaxis protein